MPNTCAVFVVGALPQAPPWAVPGDHLSPVTARLPLPSVAGVGRFLVPASGGACGAPPSAPPALPRIIPRIPDFPCPRGLRAAARAFLRRAPMPAACASLCSPRACSRRFWGGGWCVSLPCPRCPRLGFRLLVSLALDLSRWALGVPAVPRARRFRLACAVASPMERAVRGKAPARPLRVVRSAAS